MNCNHNSLTYYDDCIYCILLNHMGHDGGLVRLVIYESINIIKQGVKDGETCDLPFTETEEYKNTPKPHQFNGGCIIQSCVTDPIKDMYLYGYEIGNKLKMKNANS